VTLPVKQIQCQCPALSHTVAPLARSPVGQLLRAPCLAELRAAVGMPLTAPENATTHHSVITRNNTRLSLLFFRAPPMSQAKRRAGERGAWALVWAKHGDHYWPSILMPRDVARKVRGGRARAPARVPFLSCPRRGADCQRRHFYTHALARARPHTRAQCAADCGLAAGPAGASELVPVFFGKAFDWRAGACAHATGCSGLRCRPVRR
jgi:hypothetical protein